MPPDRERGAALLTVLLIVSVIAVLAATMLERLNMSIRLASNAGGLTQARAFALAGEDIALTRIDTLLRENPSHATPPAEWNGREFPIPFPGGTGTLTVSDGGNCFNLNGLVSQATPGGYTANPVGVAQFAQLMRLLGIPQDTGNGIAAAAADWIDSDTVVLPGGAEDQAYTARIPSYLPPNQLMTDASELRAVAGVTPEIYARLKPWVCALPEPTLSQIDVNTLTPEQAPLLAMLLPDEAALGAARAVIQARPAGGYANAADAWRLASLRGSPAGPAAQAQTAVAPRWFRLAIRVRVASSEVEQTGLIDGKQAPARLVARSWGGAD